MQYLRSAQFKTMPWKNGGGTTHEIARHDEGESFTWRISVADVAASGPFSLFPRHKRWLCVVSGSGMRLMGREGSYDAGLLQPVAFSGGEEIDGQLLDGPCRDFNLIFDAEKTRGSMAVRQGPGLVSGNNEAATKFGVYLVSGTGQSTAGNVEAGDFCWLEQATDSLTLSADAVAVTVALHSSSDQSI